jgi:hypothetical protein
MRNASLRSRTHAGQSHSLFEKQLCCAFVCDISSEEVDLPDESLDVIIMIFVLSAIHPTKFACIGVW